MFKVKIHHTKKWGWYDRDRILTEDDKLIYEGVNSDYECSDGQASVDLIKKLSKYGVLEIIEEKEVIENE